MSTSFEFSAENLDRFRQITGRYPDRQATLLPTLHLIESAGADLPNQVDIFVPGGVVMSHSSSTLPPMA